jgi:ABC-type Fe3+ transport system permease subunit
MAALGCEFSGRLSGAFLFAPSFKKAGGNREIKTQYFWDCIFDKCVRRFRGFTQIFFFLSAILCVICG